MSVPSLVTVFIHLTAVDFLKRAFWLIFSHFSVSVSIKEHDLNVTFESDNAVSSAVNPTDISNFQKSISILQRCSFQWGCGNFQLTNLTLAITDLVPDARIGNWMDMVLSLGELRVHST